MQRKLSMWAKMRAYRLQNNVYVLMMLIVAVSLSFTIYMMPFSRNVKFLPEITLACGTSLLATIFVVATEIFVKYQNHKNDQFLEGVQEFGIINLHFDKQRLLQELLADCDREVWISGYRLILTSKITNELAEAVKRGATIKMLVCPPWKEAFQSVYGTNERVMDNYFKILYAVKQVTNNVEKTFEIRFTSKPIFNDTYKVDQHLITGPYMHNRDDEYNRITANDFFTYNLVKRSRLYNLVESEFLTIWDEAEEKFDWDKFDEIYTEYRTKDLRESEKIELFRKACVGIHDDETYAHKNAELLNV